MTMTWAFLVLVNKEYKILMSEDFKKIRKKWFLVFPLLIQKDKNKYYHVDIEILLTFTNQNEI